MSDGREEMTTRDNVPRDNEEGQPVGNAKTAMGSESIVQELKQRLARSSGIVRKSELSESIQPIIVAPHDLKRIYSTLQELNDQVSDAFIASLSRRDDEDVAEYEEKIELVRKLFVVGVQLKNKAGESYLCWSVDDLDPKYFPYQVDTIVFLTGAQYRVTLGEDPARRISLTLDLSRSEAGDILTLDGPRQNVSRLEVFSDNPVWADGARSAVIRLLERRRRRRRHLYHKGAYPLLVVLVGIPAIMLLVRSTETAVSHLGLALPAEYAVAWRVWFFSVFLLLFRVAFLWLVWLFPYIEGEGECLARGPQSAVRNVIAAVVVSVVGAIIVTAISLLVV